MQNIRIIGERGERGLKESTPSSVQASVIQSFFSASNHPVVTTDFVVVCHTREDILAPNGDLLGYRCDDIVSIDHHTPNDKRLSSRDVTSTTMAAKYVHHFGHLSKGSQVGVTHKDADTILGTHLVGPAPTLRTIYYSIYLCRPYRRGGPHWRRRSLAGTDELWGRN